MKKDFLLLVCMFLYMPMNAQTILMGDMNHDEKVTIADVTSLVNVILGKAEQETINTSGNPYDVDNSLVVGTWIAPDETSFALNEDGTTTFPDAATYKFRPVQGVLTFYDASENPIRAIVLNEVTSDYLMAVDYATNVFTKYTKRQTHEYVDLGLPSGTLWATCNIGAENPEDYGDYFAWGETDGYNGGKSEFSWSTYKWCNGTHDFTKYNIDSREGVVDNKTELDLEDDAAYVNWGPAWRIPSVEQCDELVNFSYTTTVWTTQNGVTGRKITSRSNGNSIFLPAAGYRYDSSLNSAVSHGLYWSRTLYLGNMACARGRLFNSSEVYTNDNYSYRCSGRSVRPVRISE